MDLMDLKLADIQGRLFELSVKEGYDSPSFIKQFMISETAKHLDSIYNKLQWMGEEYLLEEIIDEKGLNIKKSSNLFDIDRIYWIGYIYRYWQKHTKESSKQIYKIAPVETMQRNYLYFHTMDPEMAIEDLKEIYRQKK